MIIVDHDSPESKVADLTPLLWPDADDLRVIYVTLSGDKMTVHERHQVGGAGEADLLRALKGERRESNRATLSFISTPQGRMERMDKGTHKSRLWETPGHCVRARGGRCGRFSHWSGDGAQVPPGQHAGARGRTTCWTWNGVIGFLFALVMVFMLYSLFVFRRKPGG